MNADAPPNGVNMIYPSGPNQMKSGMTMYQKNKAVFQKKNSFCFYYDYPWL